MLNAFKRMFSSFRNLSRFEFILWVSSVSVVAVSFLCMPERDVLSLIASLVGATSLIFIAKGDVIGQVLSVIFSVMYGIISYSFAYYGEMLTYLCMTAPMAVFAIISWARNPYSEHEVRVNHLKGREFGFLAVLTAVITAIFYFVLDYFNTANIVFSTISVATSFIAVYLTFRRSEYYALGYAANDIVLIILWVLATLENRSYFSMVICFVMFFANDFYGFLNWSRMKYRQKSDKSAVSPKI